MTGFVLGLDDDTKIDYQNCTKFPAMYPNQTLEHSQN
jgi:hypothetical protein